MAPVQANREVYLLLKNGVQVKIPALDGEGETVESVKLIDWNTPASNDFLLVSQFWVTGEMYTRRADLVGFVNGIPLVFIELKAAHARLETAYTEQSYRLQERDSTAFLVQRPYRTLQWQPQPCRQHDGKLGALRRMEEDQ